MSIGSLVQTSGATHTHSTVLSTALRIALLGRTVGWLQTEGFVQMWVVRNRGCVVCLGKNLHNEAIHKCTVNGIVLALKRSKVPPV